MTDRQKQIDTALQAIVTASCPWCARAARELLDGPSDDYANRWFFLSRAAACVHLSHVEKSLAKEATGG